MSSPVTTIIVTDSIKGKFGPQLKDAQGFLSFGKFYKGPTVFPEGTELEVELYITDKGNRYINKAEVSGGEVKAVPKKHKPEPGPSVLGRDGRDYDKENYGKIKTLLYQSLMPQLINASMTEDEIKQTVRKWALEAMEDDR